MNFTINDDVYTLAEAVDDFLDRHPAAVGAAPAISTVDERRWHGLCEMGAPTLLLPEPDGVSAGLIDATVFAERFGRVPLPEPVVSTIVLGAAWHRHAGGTRFDDIVDGGSICVFDPFAAVTISPGHQLSGAVRLPIDASVGALALLAADPTGRVGLAVIETADLRRPPRSLLTDVLRPTISVELSGHPCRAVFWLDPADAVRLRCEVAVLTCAELVGGMAAVVSETVRFVTDRHQFGRSVGSFQAIKHQSADMFVAVEQARAAVQFAAITVTDGGATARSDVASLSRWVPRAAISVFETAVHLHGAMGFSWEVPVHLHLRRALSVRGVLAEANLL
jgi:hypothetical protein